MLSLKEEMIIKIHDSELKNKYSGQTVCYLDYNQMLLELYKPETDNVQDIEGYDEKREMLNDILSMGDYSIDNTFKQCINPMSEYIWARENLDSVIDKPNPIKTPKICGPRKPKTPSKKTLKKLSRKEQIFQHNINRLNQAVKNYNPLETEENRKSSRKEINKYIKNTAVSAKKMARTSVYNIKNKEIRNRATGALLDSDEKLKKIQNKMKSKGLKEEINKTQELRNSISEAIKTLIKLIQELFARLLGKEIAPKPNYFRPRTGPNSGQQPNNP